jgi:copper chaperone
MVTTGKKIMKISLRISSIACEACANTITKAIKNQQPDAQVSVDVSQKIVTVESEAVVASIQEAIEGAGHTVDSLVVIWK